MQQLTSNFSAISPQDSRDHIASIPVLDNLPISVDLKPHVFEVENQYNFGSCTANAGCSALELMYNKNKTPVDLSRFYLYYYTRQLGGLKGDVGAYPRDIGKALKQYGTCYEKSWEYVDTNLDREPTAEVQQEAEQFKITSYQIITGTTDSKLQQIKSALAQNIPILLSITCHAGFFNLTGDWKQHTWDWNTSDSNPAKGGHEVLIIGYDDVSKRLLVENSWGSGWGDGGFFGVPYEMMNSSAWGELWIVSPNFDINYVPETWVDKVKTFAIENWRTIAKVAAIAAIFGASYLL